MDIDLELYRIFREVANTSSISGAAETLFVTQSAVSQAIKQLEKKIGARLFNRSVRGVSLTAEGKMLFSYIDDAISLIDNAEKRLIDMLELGTGAIRIAASDTVCNLFLLPVLERFTKNHPEIRISVANLTSLESIELLKRAEVDIAFVNLPLDKDDSLEISPVKTIHDCFVVGERYRYLADTTIEFSELTKHPVLMLETTSNSRRLMDSYLRDKGIQITPAIELGSLTLLSGFAKIGLGIALTIREEVEPLLEGSALYELNFTEDFPTRHIGVAKMKNLSLSIAAQAFVEELNNPSY